MPGMSGQDHLAPKVWKSYDYISRWHPEGYIVGGFLWKTFGTASRLHVRFHAHLVSICEASNGDQHHTLLSMLTNLPMDPNDVGKSQGKVPGMARKTLPKTLKEDYEWMLKNMCCETKISNSSAFFDGFVDLGLDLQNYPSTVMIIIYCI